MLYIIQVGHDDASDRYIRNKIKAIEEAGLEAEVVNLPEDCTTNDVHDAVLAYGFKTDCKALMVQLPLPPHINKDDVLTWIPEYRDIDGLNPKSKYKPLTPCAIMRWFNENSINLEGQLVTILGRSELVGKPLAEMLIDAGATVTVCNSKTDRMDRALICDRSDIIISAVGKIGVVDIDDVNVTGIHQIVVDVGINRDEITGKLCGDVSDTARRAIKDFGGICTPVPGGVGKWTVRELVLRLKEMERGY
jgi:methylenetetrahydrofolate dehydrogenase (NADP+)/methenyltetrahydrofolate cyclohydrolase